MKSILLPLILGLAPLVAAQTSFYADIDGTQENPPVVTDAAGWARLTLNMPAGTVTYDLRVWNLSSAATAAHIHTGVVGVNGGILKTLTMTSATTWAGTTTALTAAEIATLRASGLYVNVHTTTNPGGELRGQVLPRPKRFASFLNKAQEVPPTLVASTATAAYDVDLATNDVAFMVDTSLASTTGAHVHTAPVGVNGGITFPLPGPGPDWVGTILGIGPDDFTDFQTEANYSNVHTMANPGGAIRGQVLANGIKYGDCANVPVDLDITGTPASGGTITISITGGHSSSLGYLLVGLAPNNAVVKGEPLLVGSLFITSLVLPVGPTGELSFPSALPDLMSAPFDVYFQYANFTGGPYQVSNGVRLHMVDLPS